MKREERSDGWFLWTEYTPSSRSFTELFYSLCSWIKDEKASMFLRRDLSTDFHSLVSVTYVAIWVVCRTFVPLRSWEKFAFFFTFNLIIGRLRSYFPDCWWSRFCFVSWLTHQLDPVIHQTGDSYVSSTESWDGGLCFYLLCSVLNIVSSTARETLHNTHGNTR